MFQTATTIDKKITEAKQAGNIETSRVEQSLQAAAWGRSVPTN
jgi:hypothetical protein